MPPSAKRHRRCADRSTSSRSPTSRPTAPDAGTHPVVPFGRTGSRTSYQVAPEASSKPSTAGSHSGCAQSLVADQCAGEDRTRPRLLVDPESDAARPHDERPVGGKHGRHGRRVRRDRRCDGDARRRGRSRMHAPDEGQPDDNDDDPATHPPILPDAGARRLPSPHAMAWEPPASPLAADRRRGPHRGRHRLRLGEQQTATPIPSDSIPAPSRPPRSPRRATRRPSRPRATRSSTWCS